MIILVAGVASLTVVMLFPTWQVRYTNIAGADSWGIKDGQVVLLEADQGHRSANVEKKRAFIFGGPPKVGYEIPRETPSYDFVVELIRAETQPASFDPKPAAMWQFVHIDDAAPLYWKMTIEAAIVLVLTAAWMAIMVLLRRRSALAAEMEGR